MSEFSVNVEKLDFVRERLAKVRISARKDLSVSRHIFRGEPSYIVHDPTTMNSHRFSIHDYQILSELKRSENLEQTFQRLLNEKFLSSADEISFYEFVLNLQTKGLLDLPITDSKQLYQRHCNIEAMKSGNLASKLMFLKIPLFNPNDFLDRTLFLAKPFFSIWFFVVWIGLMICSVGLVVYRADEFFLPTANLLATRNLPIFIVVLTALKFWHELGHAYACKIRGGIVPDMGAFFMVGMPMAYVDVSSSWSFPSRRYRMMVGLGGIYFESIAAAIAVFVWSFSPPGLVNSTAHFTIIMASLMTLLFNANPLMKFDGYYILSDLLGIPNLRQRATVYLKNRFQHACLGIPTRSPASRFENWTLLIYGLGSTVYQVVLVFSICLMLATQYFVLGIVLATSFAVTSIALPVFKFLRFLFIGKETQHVRGTARAWGLGISIAVIAIIFAIPVPGATVIRGQLGFEDLQIVRLPFPCQIEEVWIEPNQEVKRDQPLVRLANNNVEDQFKLASANLYQAKAAMLASSNSQPTPRKQTFLEFEKKQREFETAMSFYQQLSVNSNLDGRVLTCPTCTDVNSQHAVGEEILRVGSGRHVVRVLLDEGQLSSWNPKIGQTVDIRFVAEGSTNRSATITRIQPAGSKKIELIGLTHLAHGNIVVNPTTGEATQPYFLIELSINDNLDSTLPDGLTANVRLGDHYETLGTYLYRRFIILAHQLSSGH